MNNNVERQLKFPAKYVDESELQEIVNIDGDETPYSFMLSGPLLKYYNFSTVLVTAYYYYFIIKHDRDLINTKTILLYVT